jgi:Zn-dependent metalloprotease
MNKKVLTLLLSGALAYTPSVIAQNKAVNFTIPVKSGSVFMSLEDKQIDKTYISQNLSALLGLSNKHSFTQLRETTDNLGFTHIDYQQFFDGVKVDNGIIMVHIKNGIVNSINGRIAQINAVNTAAGIDKQSAVAMAKSDLDIIKQIRQYPAELLIANVGSSKSPQYGLTYKVRMDGKTSKGKVVMMQVFVDAQSGKILKKVNLITTADVNGTAHTLYSGIQTIVTDDSIPGMYRLKDNARKIITYDASGSDIDENGTGTDFYLNPKDITNDNTTWDVKPALMKMTMNTFSNDIGMNIDQNFGRFLSSMVLKDTSNNLSNVKYESWPDLRFEVSSAADLPATTKNLYIFPKGDNTLIGSFGIFDVGNFFNGGSPNLQPASYFGITDLAIGTHNWDDGQGNTGSYEIATAKNPALDAHWGMERTHDFYTQIFNRNSYDGNSSVVKNYMNGVFPTAFTQDNAAALPAPYFSMVYGLGDGQPYSPFVGLDVMGHEFTHMVTETNGHGGLEYQDESGALNESFSDIMGTCIEFFAEGADANWNIGEDCFFPSTSNSLRSMSNPKSADMPQPDTYEGQYWDLSDPHFNSGVQNKWFYLLVKGGTGTNDKNDNYHVYGVGIERAEQIVYRNLTTYLTPTATFLDAYNGSVHAAKDLYGETSNEYHSVKNAWYAVGIGDADTTLPVLAINDVNVNEQHLKLSPNPASGNVTITSDIAQNVNAQIINVVGVKVMDINIHKGANNINIQSLAKGLYFVKYDNGDKGYVQKLSIQ